MLSLTQLNARPALHAPGSRVKFMAVSSAAAPLARDQRHLRDLKPFTAHFMPQSIMFSTLRVSGLRLVALGQDYFTSLEEDEEQLGAVAKEHVAHSWALFPRDVATGIVYELVITSVQRALEHLSVRTLAPKVAGRLIKDVVASAQRKAVREGKSIAARKIFKTALFSGVVTHVAVLLVDQLALGLHLLWRMRRSKHDEDGALVSEHLSWRAYLRKLRRDILLCMGRLLLGACGAAVGTQIKPGSGTRVGFLAGSFLFL